jgi:hypothetical protein
VPRVVGAFGTDNALREAGSGELIYFFRDIEYISGREATPWKPEFAGHNDRMSLQEIQKEIAQLSAEERDALRRHLDQLALFSDDKVMEEWTRNNRDAEAGAVVSREQAVAQLKAAGKQLR